MVYSKWFYLCFYIYSIYIKRNFLRLVYLKKRIQLGTSRCPAVHLCQCVVVSFLSNRFEVRRITGLGDDKHKFRRFVLFSLFFNFLLPPVLNMNTTTTQNTLWYTSQYYDYKRTHSLIDVRAVKGTNSEKGKIDLKYANISHGNMLLFYTISVLDNCIFHTESWSCSL